MKIFIGGLHINTSETMLRDLFNNYGEVLSVVVVVDEMGKPEGYGYVEMEDEADGHEAIKKLNKINFMNQFLDVYKMD